MKLETPEAKNWGLDSKNQIYTVHFSSCRERGRRTLYSRLLTFISLYGWQYHYKNKLWWGGHRM